MGDNYGFGVEPEVRERLAGEQLREAETDAYIVNRLVAALAGRSLVSICIYHTCTCTHPYMHLLI